MLRTVKSTRANLTTLATILAGRCSGVFLFARLSQHRSHPVTATRPNYISELGVPGSSQLAVVMNLGFWLQGSCF